MPVGDSKPVGNVEDSQLQHEGQNKKAPGYWQELKPPEDCKNYIEGRLSHDFVPGWEIDPDLGSSIHSVFQKAERSQQS